MLSNRLKYIKKLKNKEYKPYYRSIKYPNIPVSSNDIYAITTSGDRLDLLAEQFYGDLKLWWVISVANNGVIRRDSYALEPGLEIRIPTGINSILREFENINSIL